MAVLGILHIWEHHGHAATLLETLILVVYGLAWVVLYGCSTLYHASRHLERKAYLRILDHCAIFIVIAASYGPFVLHILNDRRGYIIWFLSWLIALGGCIFKFRSEHRYHVQSTWAYVVQGWMVTITLPALIAGLSTAGFLWMLIGGVSLTGGIYFYIRDDVKYNHGVWHLSVLLGSLGFYLAILDILPS